MFGSKKGVTIIELSVVVLLIGIIGFALLPFVRVVRAKARQRVCVDNLRKISVALRVYALENNERLPQDLTILFTKGYVESERVFDCPFTGFKGNSKEPEYVYIKGLDFMSDKNKPIAYDKKDNHAGEMGNVLYLNGEVVHRNVGAMAE